MTILDTICEATRRDLEVSKCMLAMQRLERQAADMPAPPNFADVLRVSTSETPPRIIAELKKASPSKGLIRDDFGVISLARELESAGAAALSVLTEVRWFQGSPTYLRAVAANVDLPVLRKDFIVDEYQVVQARALGAAAVLLIAACLDNERLKALSRLVRQLGMQALVEVHDRAELDRVLDEVQPAVVGVNCRDLKTFETDPNAVAEVLAAIPEGIVRVAESGIRTVGDIRRVREAGTHAFLVGETLMCAERPGEALKELLS